MSIVDAQIGYANVRRWWAVALLLFAVASPALAQRPVPAGAPGAWVGGGLVIAQPTGQFANYVDIGFGGTGYACWSPGAQRIFGLRADASYLIYGRETRRYQLPLIDDLDVTTENTIAGLQFGPQITVGGRDVLAYGYGQLGFSDFATTSSVDGSGDVESFANTTNFDDVTFATSGGGGLLVQLSHGATPVALDLGARYLANGRARYPREGSIQITGSTVSYTPIESETNLVAYQIGFSIGWGRRDARGTR